MNDAIEGRLGALSLLLAQVLVALARRSDVPDAWLDEIEAHCDLSPMSAKRPDVGVVLTAVAARDQLQDTLRIARELNQFRTYLR